MQKNVQIPLELFDDLVILVQGLNDGCDIDAPLFKQLVGRVHYGVRQKRKSIALRKLYKESIAAKNADYNSDSFQNYINTKEMYKLF